MLYRSQVASLLLCILLSHNLAAKEKPVLEVGVGVTSFVNPDYLGADQNTSYVFPFPYVIYRGDYIRADRSGLRGFIYDSEKLDLRMSFGGSLPVNSEDNDARAGMEDLDVMVETGPNLEYQLYKDNKRELRLDLPVRAGFLLGSNFMHHQGWTSNPRIYYSHDYQDWRIVSTLGVVFSDSRYHGYTYNVNADEILDDRPFYQASSGYTGSRFSISAKRQFGRWVTGANMRYYNISGAKNVDSPLVKQHDYVSVGFYVAWLFYQSPTKTDE